MYSPAGSGAFLLGERMSINSDMVYQRSEIVDNKMKELMRYIRECRVFARTMSDGELDMLDNIEDRVDLIQHIRKTDNGIELAKYCMELPFDRVKGLDGRRRYNHWL